MNMCVNMNVFLWFGSFKMTATIACAPGNVKTREDWSSQPHVFLH